MNRLKVSYNPISRLFMVLLMTAALAACGSGNDDVADNGTGVTTGNGTGDGTDDGTGDGTGDGDGGDPGPAGASPDIGTASTYAVFASDAAVTLAVDSLVEGDVGLNPAGDCNNCVVGVTVTGEIHNGDAEAIQAQDDFEQAYLDASTRSTNACTIVDGELSSAQGDCDGFTPGPIYRPGLYRTANPIGIGVGFSITLDAQGNPDAVFIFQTDSAITTGTDSTVILAGDAQARNVWWIAGTAATLGVSSIFKGTVIANSAQVEVLNGTSLEPTLVEGRLFSNGAAAVVNEFATVTVPE